MPSFVPRNEPRKKKEEMDIKKQVLKNAILNSLSIENITRKAEIYKDMEWKNKEHSFDTDKATKEIENWENKSVETVIEEVRKQLTSFSLTN